MDADVVMDVDELRARVRSDVARLATELDVPGVSVVVQRGAHSVEVTHGVVNTRSRVPVTVDTVFHIQSVTKLFTATLVLQLVDEGRVALDDPVHAHVPGFRTADDAASREITVRHLLTHTGGFEGDLWQPTTDGPDALDRFVREHVSPRAAAQPARAPVVVLQRRLRHPRPPRRGRTRLDVRGRAAHPPPQRSARRRGNCSESPRSSSSTSWRRSSRRGTGTR